MQLPDTLLRLFLELLRRGGEVGVLVTEQLVGDLAGQQHPNVGVLMNPLAQQIHAHAGPDSGDIKGAQQVNHILQRIQHQLPGHDHLGVVTADVVCHLLGVFQVDGVLAHADGKGADGGGALLLGDGAYQGGVQTAGEQEAHLGVGHQPLLHARHQLVMNLTADRLQIIVADGFHMGDIPVADELAVLIVMAGREGHDLVCQPHQTLGLAGKENHTGLVIAVVQRPDADGVTGRHKAAGLGVEKNQGKLSVQHGEHIHAVLLVEGQQHLAVGFADKVMGLAQLRLELVKAVDFPVADHIAAVQLKGLHPFRVQAHDGQPVKAQQAFTGVHNAGVVRPPGFGCLKMLLENVEGDTAATVTHD